MIINIFYDNSTATAQIIEPNQLTYDKKIPNMKILSYIFYLYANIWGLSDDTVIGFVINVYVAMLLIWKHFENYSFKCIFFYFIDYFETHQ